MDDDEALTLCKLDIEVSKVGQILNPMYSLEKMIGETFPRTKFSCLSIALKLP